MNIAQKLKDYRVFSIIITSIVVYQLNTALNWIMELSKDNPTMEQVGLATATLTALCALVKFCLSFATTNNGKENNNANL